MYKKLYGGLGVLLLLMIGVFVFLFVKNQAEIRQLEREAVEAQKLLQQRNAPTVPQGEHPPHAHFHEDGTFHEGEPPDPIQTQPAARDYTPTRVEIPEGITDPDVQAAWERVDSIANNIWEWGGVPSHRTVELIDQLMPPPDGFSGPTGHSDLEETINLLGSLDTNDPRSAEVLATYLCEGRVGGGQPIDMLVDVGVPAVPYLIPYMLDMEMSPVLLSYPIEVLGRIAEKHREELGGIVDHIIIPRLTVIAAIGDPPGKMYSARESAQEALARLK